MRTALVFPIYKPILNSLEIKRLSVTFASNPGTEKYFLYPANLDLQAYEPFLSHSHLIPWEPVNFISRDHYNRLMLSEDLYVELSKYMENVIICQNDAFLIRSIHDLSKLGFDYIGAAWNPAYRIAQLGKCILINRPLVSQFSMSTILTAGNGGLSYRNLKSILRIIRTMKRDYYWKSLVSLNNRKMNEDLALVFYGIKSNFRIADKSIADKIFIETTEFALSDLSFLYGFHALGRSNPSLENYILDNFVLN